MTLHRYEHRSVVPADIESVLSFHRDEWSLSRLTPPPMFVCVRRDARTSLTRGELDFVLWVGPFPIRWLADHSPGPTRWSFVDRMAAGPLKCWEHEHLFEPAGTGVRITDRVTFAHKPGLAGWWTRMLFSKIFLAALFRFRHARTRQILARSPAERDRQNI